MTLSADLITDLDVFMDADEFAVAIVYTPQGAAARTIYGIFDARHEYFSPLDGELAGLEQVLWCKTSDVSAVRANESMVIAGTTYRVIGAEPDGTGLTMVRLTK